MQYVVNQLKCCESLDLLVLKEMVSTMAGVDPVFDISDTQLDALAGSETLIRQVVAQTDAWRRDRAAQRGMQRLLAALRVGPPAQQLAIPLLILLAQQRKLITLQPQSFHLKLVAELYDKCHEVTMQYIEFLHKALPAEEYASLLPSISELATEYRIDPEIIFELYRPIIRGVLPPAAPVDDFAEPEAGEVAQVGNAPAQVHHPVGDDKAKPAAGGDDDEEGEIAGAPTEPGGAQAMDVEDGEVAGAGGAAVVENSHVVPEEYGGPIWEELAAHTASLVPEGGFKGLTQTLFVTFWSLSLYDLDVPVDRYESTLAQVRSAARMARDDLEAARRDTQRGLNRYGHGGHGGGFGMQPPPPPPPPQQVELDVMTRELERLEATAAQLPMDLKEQQANAAAVEARLRETRGAW